MKGPTRAAGGRGWFGPPDKKLARECPRCKAAPGWRCVTRGAEEDVPMAKVHPERARLRSGLDYDRPCPVCGAEAGRACRRRIGTVTTRSVPMAEVHPERKVRS